jgi:hypothetical protein
MRRACDAVVVALVLAVVAGCAGLPAPGADPAPLADARALAAPALRECAQRIAEHDSAVRAAQVSDGGAARLAGLPYLRTDRFLASFADALATQPALRVAWLREARALDRQARALESANLPGGDAAAAQAVERCAEQLFAAEMPLLEPSLLAARARVPDDYNLGWRIAGLYPLVAMPFAAGVRGWEREASARFAAPASVDRRLWPNPVAPAGAPSIASLPKDALGRVTPGDAERLALLAAYAPVWALQVAGPADAPGAIRFDAGGLPRVDPASPDVYATLAWTRIGEQVLLQFVYQIWFDERPARGRLDLLAGRLDSVIVRITVDDDGVPVMLDTIHGCGCYHMFLPSPRLQRRPPPAPFVEWAFVPAALPAWTPASRFQVRLEAATHYVVGVDAVTPRAAGAPAGADAGASYRLQELDALRSLPWPAGGRRSLYAPDGLVPGTERAERWLFWPMGIASPGAMRQWGRHATAFIGRRHFDDPRLFDQRFERRAER